ncbi:MAG: threonylcarbamoyl-AMP synthase [Propionibacteriaceae bacterium]|jgi:tRNA threonylcarbamoyl adenosine modification protein (Sua5/YciO/YrdC/YwlC family)|nr:threonylcarbamoyl-AMP synthase [Propionibacteriaceae bacterium]
MTDSAMSHLATSSGVIWALDDPGLIDAVEACLAKSACFVMPTDTVYGLAAAASDQRGVDRLQTIKGRDDHFPPPVLLSSIDQAWPLIDKPSPYLATLARAGWPGAMTLIVNSRRVGMSLIERVGTVGLRVPDRPAVQQLLAQTGPLAVSSANRHGLPAATTVEMAAGQLADDVELLIDGGPSGDGIASTVVDCTGNRPKVLRVGQWTQDQINDLVGVADA